MRQARLNPKSWLRLFTWLHVPNSQASKDSTCSETSPTSPVPEIIWKLLIKVRWKNITRINIKNNCVPFSTLKKQIRIDFQELCVFGISPAYLQKASEATVVKSTSTGTNDSSPWETAYGILSCPSQHRGWNTLTFNSFKSPVCSQGVELRAPAKALPCPRFTHIYAPPLLSPYHTVSSPAPHQRLNGKEG